MSELEQVRAKLSQALVVIREAVDISLQIMSQGPSKAKEVSALWENFLREFLSYIKQKSRETGRNLFAAISFPRIWPR